MLGGQAQRSQLFLEHWVTPDCTILRCQSHVVPVGWLGEVLRFGGVCAQLIVEVKFDGADVSSPDKTNCEEAMIPVSQHVHSFV